MDLSDNNIKSIFFAIFSDYFYILLQFQYGLVITIVLILSNLFGLKGMLLVLQLRASRCFSNFTVFTII